MKKQILVAFFLTVTLSACTYSRYNAETREFSFYSTKEYKHFEVKYVDPASGAELSLLTKDVKAFKGREMGLKTAVKLLTKVK